MGRKTKKGLDYFSLTTSFTDSIRLCAIELGSDAICVLIELWQDIYKNNGYYLELTEDHKMLFVKNSMSGIKLEKFNKCLDVYFKRGVFDFEKYQKYQILTSDSVQERYVEACSMTKRTNVLIYSEYLLIDLGVNDKFIIESKNKLGVNTEILGANTEESTQRKEKKRKEENKKEKKEIFSENDFNVFKVAKDFYKGTKDGSQTEFNRFMKHKDWKQCLPLLLPAMIREKIDKQKLIDAGKFSPNWKNFSTWLNNRCWETEYPNVSQADIDKYGINVTTSANGEQKVEVKQDRSSFPLYSSMQMMPHVYPEGTESRCGYYVIKDKQCVRTQKY